jgi:hypothetical protein
MATLQTINNVKVQAIPSDKKDDNLPVKGKEMFGVVNSTALLVARRGSGKTTLLYNIIKNTCDKRTHIYFFVSTAYSDDSWQAIFDLCDSRKIGYEIFTDLIEDKVDHLANVIEHMKEAKEALLQEEEQKNEPKEPEIVSFGGQEYKKIRKKKEKNKVPRFVVICDDVGAKDLRSQSMVKIFKTGRHYCMSYISTQGILDVSPVEHSNNNFYLLFRGINLEKLKKSYDAMPLTISFEKLVELYQLATVDSHDFLYINVTTGDIRKNFNQKFIL